MKAPKPTHYENFPVASWLCPPRLRAPIYAIYAFARLADDIADEGNATADERLTNLGLMKSSLVNTPAAGRFQNDPGSPWINVFAPLHDAIEEFNLPVQLFLDLLDAFCQDIVMTRDGATYANQAELYGYCRRSANPIGRLLLHLYDISDEESLWMSDQICTALQLINFWQDLSRDLPNGRHYLTDAVCEQFSVDRSALQRAAQTPDQTLMVAHLVREASEMMHRGVPLCRRIPGRAGWELRLVVQGGLRILDKIERINFQTLRNRPSIGKADILVMGWRSLWM